MFTTLIDGATLVSRVGEPDCIAIDCRASLGDPDYGRTAYREGHIPGARYADLDRDLAAAPGKRGRHPLPDRDALARRFAAWGIRHGDQLVAYDDAGGLFACRFWWLARWLGIESCAVLDGGLAAYLEAGGDLTREVRAVDPSSFRSGAPLTRVVEAEDIIADRPSLTLIDARAEARYLGEEEPIDRIAGHIPGAFSYPLRRESRLHGPIPPRRGTIRGARGTQCRQLLRLGRHRRAEHPRHGRSGLAGAGAVSGFLERVDRRSGPAPGALVRSADGLVAR